MKRHALFLMPALVLSAVMACPPVVQARTLDLAFMPPVVEPQDLCSPEADAAEDDLTVEGGDEALSDTQRLRYLERDIRNLQSQDADRWFDFIMTLIDWKAKIDAEFGPTEVLLAQIALYVDAGRLEALQAEGLIDRLRQDGTALTNAQKMTVAQYYLNGIGVAQDVNFARGLIRDAAYGGNAEALMSLARMDLQGSPVEGWDAPLDLTVTLAFGGMLGQMNAQVCGHAESIAREYVNGDVVTPNTDVAYAWFKFAADLGGAQGAWRIVEFHLDAAADRKDNAEMLKYLRLAVQRGITLEEGQIERVKSAGKVDEATLRQILGFNHSSDLNGSAPAVSRFFQLSVNLDGDTADDNNPFQDYLRELTEFDTAPGWVFTALATEVMVRRGRWAAEAEAMELLDEAAKRGDPAGMQLLAEMLMRYRDDPARVSQAINLLHEAVSRFGVMSAMQDLDTLFRCQLNDAPRLAEADLWATNFRATQDETVEVSPGDLVSLDPYKKPEMIAMLQTQALAGRPQSLSKYLERVQRDAFATTQAERLWAARTNQSDQALEMFAELEFALAGNPAERDLAVELFRRIYLNNGVTSALDLAIALTEDNARDPAIAKEIIQLLTKAANRGEGAAIRLKARLMGGEEGGQKVFQEYEQIIEDRGDFLALMFAMPYIANAKADDYIDRAVSLMNCTTKDTDELGEATATVLSPDLTYHWRQVGLVIDGGNVLAKLGLSDVQMAVFEKGAATSERGVYARELADGNTSALRSLFRLTADPGLATYDPEAAAEHLAALLNGGGEGDETFVLANFRNASGNLRELVSRKIDMGDVYLRAARRGDVSAKLDYALLLRETATTLADLQSSARWLKEAAEGGNVTAMTEMAEVLTTGIGVPQDRRGALNWAEQAERAGDPRARRLARLLRLERVE